MADDSALDGGKTQPGGGRWKQKVAACRKIRDAKIKDWQVNVAMRKNRPFLQAPTIDSIAVPVDWSRTKNKQSQLFFQVPEVKLRARQPEYMSAAATFAAAVNFELQHEIKVDVVMDEVLADVINAAGIGIAMVTYEASFEVVQVPAQDTSAMAPEQLQQLQASGQMQMTEVQRPVYECYGVKRISPAKFLWPSDFTGADWQTAQWLGYEDRMTLAEAKRLQWVKDGFVPANGTDKDKTLNERNNDSEHDPIGPTVQYQQIFYRPFFVDPAEKNPKKLKRIVFVDGVDDPVVHEDFQWQKYVTESRRFIGLTTFPIKVATLTTISDEAIPPSDSEIGRSSTLELNKSRSQIIKQRDRSLPVRWYDTNMLDEEVGEQLRKGTWQDMIPVNGPGDRAVGEVARAQMNRESFEFQTIIERDLDNAWSQGQNQQGFSTSGDTSATEATIMQDAYTVRLDYERAKFAKFFVEIAEGIGGLMQMFADEEKWVELVGPNGAKKMESWDKNTIRGDFIFETKPDAAAKVDIGQKRVEAINLYKMVRQDPMINAQALVAELVELHGMDPADVVVQPQQPPPQKPTLRYTFGGADLTNPVVVALIQKSDQPLTPDDIASAKKLMTDAGIPVVVPTAMPLPDLQGPDAPTAVDDQSQAPQVPHPGPPPSVNPINQRYEMGAQ